MGFDVFKNFMHMQNKYCNSYVSNVAYNVPFTKILDWAKNCFGQHEYFKAKLAKF